MSFCCENPIDLGCQSACAPITTNIVINSTAFYIIVYEFAGALISREFEATPVGGYLQVPSYIFNESQNVTFQIYDTAGVIVACYKARILSGNTTIEPNPPTPMTAVDTYMNVDAQVVVCSNGLNTDQLSILKQNGSIIDSQKIGTIYHIQLSVHHGGNPHPYQLYYDITLTQPLSQNKFVVTDPIQVPTFYISVQLSNCNQKYDVTAVVTSIENMNDGYYNGTNTPVNYTVN